MLSLVSFSQITVSSELLSEINTRLIDGLEYHALLQNCSEQVNTLDSITLAQGKLISNLQEQNRLQSDNLWHSETRNTKAMQEITGLMADNTRLEKRLRTWRNVGIGGIVIGVGTIAYLISR